jgi:hypothetical protein
VNLDIHSVIRAVMIGVGATLFMDLWNLFLKRAFGIPSLNYALLGRWLLHMPRGTFRHANINAAEPQPFETQAGWLAHYSIGIMLAVVFIALGPRGWLTHPTVLPALVYGIGTVVFPYFILQPALGLGVASAKTAKPLQARLKSLATHTVFGVGLFVCARVLAL